MRLLTRDPASPIDEPSLILQEFIGTIPPYTILSHRWGPDQEEVSFKDIETPSPSLKSKKGYQKIMNSYRQAVSDGFEYLWVDTCCIDKSSSAELSEGINSMYAWYRDSVICYAYLEDVGSEEDPSDAVSQFRKSVWFRRGWTLQELLAPVSVVFIASDWVEIGAKSTLAKVINEVTGIDATALVVSNHGDFSIAKRMSWAAERQTTREEDRAYSLLGIFGVHMPPIYGEGKKAFHRLQIEILNQSTDQTIFAWNTRHLRANCGMSILADSPDNFYRSHHIDSIASTDFATQFNIDTTHLDYAVTNAGLKIHLPLMWIKDEQMLEHFGIPSTIYSPESESYLAFLGCKSSRTRRSDNKIFAMNSAMVIQRVSGSLFERREHGGHAIYEVSMGDKLYVTQPTTILIRGVDFAEMEDPIGSMRLYWKVYQLVLEASDCDTFEEIVRSCDETWRNRADESANAGVLYRCKNTQEQFAAVVGFEGPRVWCGLIPFIMPDGTLGDANTFLALLRDDFFSIHKTFSDWVSIPRQKGPGKIIIKVRRGEDELDDDITYVFRISVR